MKFRITHYKYIGFIAIAYTDRGPRVLYKIDDSYAVAKSERLTEPFPNIKPFTTTAEAEEACRAFAADNGGYDYEC